ncbi:MAG: cadmium-translocating P-type ATPase [Candidatus Nomurabacteria bacterium]|jgi:heavy metal translocating P-type ATPase|nr:cadmium-translocating P-type ATPase [Candidatus Nomurabacteria bacterium]
MLKTFSKIIASLIITIIYIILIYLFQLESEAHTLVIIFGLFISITLIVDMAKSIKSGHHGIDILALTAIISTIIVGEFLAALIIIIMLTGGEALENYANHRAKRELSKLINRAPTIAHLEREDGSIEDKPIKQIKLADLVIVKIGEIVPIDGILISPNATLDTSSLTGESTPYNYQKGDRILSGSVNQDNPLKIRVTNLYKDSQYNQIIQMVKEIESKPSHFVRLADRYAIPFTILAYAIAGIAWAVTGEFMRFAEVLVVASPCPLILAAPVAFISGISQASSAGIIIKSGSSLEQLANAKSIAFDKTGTLSRGSVSVDSVISFNETYTSRQILKLIASAEQSSPHVLARSIIYYAAAKNIKLEQLQDVTDHTGMGVDVVHDGQKIIIGSSAHMKKHRIPLNNIRNHSRSSVFLAIDQKIIGQITFTDIIRSEARSVVSQLKKFGIKHVVMITGDSQENAEKAANTIGISEFYAECLPINKVWVAKKLPKPSIFVGDGINDAPALAASDVSMALAAFGSTAASDAASVVIMADNLRKVPLTVNIAKHTMNIAYQSVIGGMVLCLILMVLASFGFIPVILGALLQEGMDVLSILNALRARK